MPECQSFPLLAHIILLHYLSITCTSLTFPINNASHPKEASSFATKSFNVETSYIANNLTNQHTMSKLMLAQSEVAHQEKPF